MTTRIIYSDNGTLVDWSTSLNNYYSGDETFSFVAAEDYIYIGNLLPFNHTYMKFTTPSVASSTLSVDIWDGNAFSPAAEIIDETAGFTADGFINWVPDKNKGWGREDTNVNGTERVTGLGTITIYDRYWVRIGFNNDLTASSVASWSGLLFSDDNDLKTEYPNLVRSNVLTAFQAGKVNWEEQNIRAAELMVDDLIDMNVIASKEQIIERKKLSRASVCKVAEIIYNGFGDDGVEDSARARKEYKSRISKNVFITDKDNDARIDREEASGGQGRLYRGY